MHKSCICPRLRFPPPSLITVLYPLGITVERVVCFETATVTRAATLEECLLQLQEQALQQALQQADFTVTDTVYDVTAQGVYATVYGERHVR